MTDKHIQDSLEIRTCNPADLPLDVAVRRRRTAGSVYGITGKGHLRSDGVRTLAESLRCGDQFQESGKTLVQFAAAQ
jgi:hypothetical protein